MTYIATVIKSELWGANQEQFHNHTCRKCGQIDSCNGNHCPEREEWYICYDCFVGQYGA